MSKIVYLYVKTSLSLLLPINCNDDQNYVCQLSTTFIHHTLSMWAHYSPWDPYDLFVSFYFFLFSVIHSISWKNNQDLDSTLIFIIYSSRTRLHRGIIKQNSKLDHAINFILLDQDITKRIELRKMVKIKVMVIRYRGTPPSLAVAKWSAHTQILNSSLLEETVVILLMV